MDPALRELLVGVAIVLSFLVVLASVWIAAADDSIRLRRTPRRRRWKSQVR
jgi:hypothetical protein